MYILFGITRVLISNNAKLNYFIILGSAILYISVFFYSYASINPKTQLVFCNVSFIVHGLKITYFIVASVAVLFGIQPLFWGHFV